jgi:hypothetical protein
MEGAHDVLVAYRDGSARYLNYSGKVVVWEDRSLAPVQAAINDWLAHAQAIAEATGPWDQLALPPVPAGHSRVMALTPGGPHFGQGPVDNLFADPMAGPFLAAATTLVQLILAHPTT